MANRIELAGRIQVQRIDLDDRRPRAPVPSRAHLATSSTAVDVVRMTDGEQSRNADETRSSWTRNCGTGSGTAMKPACSAPRKATMYSSPSGARIAARSPTSPQSLSSSATTSARGIHLRPCQALGETGGVDLIVNEGVGRGIGLLAGSFCSRPGRDDWVIAIALPSCRVLLLLTGVSHVGVGCINAQWAY